MSSIFVGDNATDILNWTTIGPIPEVVAHKWVIEVASSTNLEGAENVGKVMATPMTSPMEKWATGLMVVVLVSEKAVLSIMKMHKGYFLMQRV